MALITTDFVGIFLTEIAFLPTGSGQSCDLLFIFGKSEIIRAILIYCGKFQLGSDDPSMKYFYTVLLLKYIFYFL